MIRLSSNYVFCGGFLWEDINKISKLNINYQKKDVILESKLSHVNLTIPHLTREFLSIFIIGVVTYLFPTTSGFRSTNSKKLSYISNQQPWSIYKLNDSRLKLKFKEF
jgi:hypothetical protein